MDWISTKTAMQKLGVGSTTIKRWADDGTLPSRRTAGGHRRFRRDEVDQLLWQQSVNGEISRNEEWVELLTHENDVMEIRDQIIQLRRRLGDWYRAADFLDNVMRGIRGRRSDDVDADAWSLIVSGRLCIALSAISRSFAATSTAPTGLLASVGERQLTYRLSLTQLCARSEGIELLRPNAGTPVKELVSLIGSWRQRLVILCTLDQCGDCSLLHTAYRDISAACKVEGVQLVVGFGRVQRDIGDYGHNCQSFEDLRRVLQT
jgi:excisionase family DNA binding protein